MALQSSFVVAVEILGDGVSTQIKVDLNNDPVLQFSLNSFLVHPLPSATIVSAVAVNEVATNAFNGISIAVTVTSMGNDILLVFATPPDAYSPVLDNFYSINIRLKYAGR